MPEYKDTEEEEAQRAKVNAWIGMDPAKLGADTTKVSVIQTGPFHEADLLDTLEIQRPAEDRENVILSSHEMADSPDHENPLPRGKEKSIPVIEIFGPTIQGEGTVAGVQTIFIRFGLCDFKCTMCDSMHAVDPKLVKANATWMTNQEIFIALTEFMMKNNCSHIETITLSGGNPAIHDLTHLVESLNKIGKRVQVETQGTKSPKWLALCDTVVVSPKSPGMGEQFSTEVLRTFIEPLALEVHGLGIEGPKLCIKIVVFSALDLEFAASVFAHIMTTWPYLVNPYEAFYLSLGNPYPPKFVLGYTDEGVEGVGVDDSNLDKIDLVKNLLSLYNNLSEEILQDQRLRHARFLPQLHVLVWGNDQGR